MRSVLVLIAVMSFAFSSAVSAATVSADLTLFDGIWVAPFPAPTGVPARLVVIIAADSDGAAVVTAASPDQGFAELPVTEVETDQRKISFNLPAVGARFSGSLTSEGRSEIRGVLAASGLQLPLTFHREASVPAVVERAQTPKPPFPYRVEEVTYESVRGVRLAGTLTLPPGAGPHPAAVLLGVALPDDRDGSFANHRFYAVLADALTRRGIAVLRSDDRGVGGSSGDYFQSTYEDLVADAQAARALVLQRPEIDTARVGFVGWSEGTAIAALAAAEAPEVAFLVFLGGLGQPAREALPEQAAAIAAAMGLPPDQVADQRRRTESLIATVIEEPDVAARRARIEALATAGRLSTVGMVSVRPGTPSTLDLLASPWYRSQFSYDPQATLAKVGCPVLAVTGSLDRVLPPRGNLAGFLTALSASETQDFALIQLAGLNHLMQPARFGLPIEYSSLPVTVSPLLLSTVGEWVSARTMP